MASFAVGPSSSILDGDNPAPSIRVDEVDELGENVKE